MRILCHRGLWHERSERNTIGAFRAAWARGWGIETDVRDRDGELVISHDPPTGPQLRLAELLAAWAAEGPGTPLALNIKADGLALAVRAAAAEAGIGPADGDTVFAFDMSVPDLVVWAVHPGGPVPAYTRWSDLEPDPVLLDRTAGLWLDAFDDDLWWSPDCLAEHLDSGRSVVVVSPELHGRRPDKLWSRLAGLDIASHPGLALCTDKPDPAERWLP